MRPLVMSKDKEKAQQLAEQQQVATVGISAQAIAQSVKEDIKWVLANSWELQQLNCTAPKVSQSTLNCLSVPRRARIQQQVTQGLHDVCDFAEWKTGQLAKRRAAKQAAQQGEQQQRVAAQEALQGWRREREQFGRQLHMLHQEQVVREREVARQSAMLATQQAKHDLEVLKEKQQRQRMHAAEVHKQMAAQRMDTRMDR